MTVFSFAFVPFCLPPSFVRTGAKVPPPECPGGQAKKAPAAYYPKRRDGALIRLRYYCSARHLSPDPVHKL